MGILFVLIFYVVALTIAASLGSLLLRAIAHRLLGGAGTNRKRPVIVSMLFPFACVLFAGIWFIAYATINTVVFHRDPGLGDSWETPLPNGYALLMIDTNDEGTVYNPATQSGEGGVSSRNDAVFGVRQLQVSNNLIFGAWDTGYFGRSGQDSTFVDSYFELDTRRNQQTPFPSLEALRSRAASEGVALHLRKFASVFSDYRTTWFDHVSVITLLAVPVIGLVFLARWLWKIRQSTRTAPPGEVLQTASEIPPAG